MTLGQVVTARSHPPRRPGRPKIETPNPIDIRVGTRLRLRRNMLGLSQEKLGEAIGLTFQQIQKYERGANRIGASRPDLDVLAAARGRPLFTKAANRLPAAARPARRRRRDRVGEPRFAVERFLI